MDPDYLELTRADSGKLKPTMVMVTQSSDPREIGDIDG